MSNKSHTTDDWVISKRDIVAVRKSEGFCLVCNKKLSIYNYNKYCFIHQFENARDIDRLAEKRHCDQNRYYREKKMLKNSSDTETEKIARLRKLADSCGIKKLALVKKNYKIMGRKKNKVGYMVGQV